MNTKPAKYPDAGLYYPSLLNPHTVSNTRQTIVITKNTNRLLLQNSRGCNGICTRFENIYYNNGNGHTKPAKYCSSCAYYIVTKDLFCSCCKHKYRVSRRHRKRQIE